MEHHLVDVSGADNGKSSVMFDRPVLMDRVVINRSAKTSAWLLAGDWDVLSHLCVPPMVKEKSPPYLLTVEELFKKTTVSPNVGFSQCHKHP